MESTLTGFLKTIGVIFGGLIVALLLLLGSIFFSAPGCENTIYETILSPNRTHEVILYNRDCGATTGYSTHLSLAEVEEDIDSGSEILVADADHGKANSHPVYQNLIDVRMRWINDHLLELSYDKNARIFTEKDKVGEITIVHCKR